MGKLLFSYMAFSVTALIGCTLHAVATRRTLSYPLVDGPVVELIASVLAIAGLYGSQRIVLIRGRKHTEHRIRT